MHMNAALLVLQVLLAVLHSAGVATDLPRDVCSAGGVARACSAMQVRLSQLPASFGLQDREARVRLSTGLRLRGGAGRPQDAMPSDEDRVQPISSTTSSAPRRSSSFHEKPRRSLSFADSIKRQEEQLGVIDGLVRNIAANTSATPEPPGVGAQGGADIRLVSHAQRVKNMERELRQMQRDLYIERRQQRQQERSRRRGTGSPEPGMRVVGGVISMIVYCVHTHSERECI
jgi:hypothetical protein